MNGLRPSEREDTVKPIEPFESHQVECPYCGETVALGLEADVMGELVVDCEVCCNPWRVRVERYGDERRLVVGRDDD